MGFPPLRGCEPQVVRLRPGQVPAAALVGLGLDYP